MPKKPLNDTKTAIWITSKCRMQSERRFRRYNVTSHLLLSWLSLSVISWAVARGSIEQSTYLDIYTAIMSTFIFAFSIIVFGFRFGETAAQHRECYLKLMKLYDGNLPDEDLKRQYQEVLGAHENHSTWDYESLILDRTLLKNDNLWTSSESKISWTPIMLFKHVILVSIFWLFAIAVFCYGLGTYYLIFTNL